MSAPSGDPLDTAARYLATGDPTGLPGDGTRHRLDRTLALLAERCTWEQPSPRLLDAITDRVERIEWDEHLDRLGPTGWVDSVDGVTRRGGVERIEPSNGHDRSDSVVRIDGFTGAGRLDRFPEVGGSPKVGGVDSSPGPDGVRGGRHHRKTRRARRARRTSWQLIGAAAAAALAVVAIVGAAVAGLVRSSPPSTDGGRELALVGTDLAPGARATATLRATPSGVAVTLQVHGLDPAPLGFYYQAWMKGPRGAVAIGSFHVRDGNGDGDGDGEPIELWSGVDPAVYPEITVTLEPEDGDPASSGRKVLGAAPGPVQSDQRTGTSGSGT